MLQDFVQDLTQDLKVFLAKILETSCPKYTTNVARSFQNPVRICV